MSEGLFFTAFTLIVILFFMFSLFRIITRLKKDKKGHKTGMESQVGFVVDTFHELVSKLKEKEKELENLRKKAEERADVVESYNEYILQSVPSGVISLDRELRITKVNSAAERILRIKAYDVINRSYSDIFGEPVKGLLEAKTFVERKEFMYTLNTGKKIHIGISLTPLIDARNETIGQLMVFTDLSELKALESQAELRDRLSSLGEMAAGMAHELRNPMGVIAGYTKLLSKKTDSSLINVIDAISREIDVMDRVITDFLSFARPTELKIAMVNLKDVIANCVSNILSVREDIKVYLNIDNIPQIYGDEILLRQAFINLIQNAVEAMPYGGVLRIGFSVNSGHVEITVADSGHGIPQEIKDKVFLPFYTTKDKGTGLGLAIVHKTIVSHRGSVLLDSSENGTAFRVILPLILPNH